MFFLIKEAYFAASSLLGSNGLPVRGDKDVVHYLDITTLTSVSFIVRLGRL
jgi:hypothetical protein